MAFIGNTNTTQAFTPAVDYFSGNGSTTAFTLSRPVASVAQVEAVIDNVVQNPSSAYTVSSNTITFTSAPLAGTNNIYVRYTSPITQVIAPGQGTVNTTALGNITNIASGNSSLTLQTGSSNTTAVTIDTSQNVGIGTASPTARLSVAQTGIAVNIGDISSAPSSNVNVFVGPSTSALSGTNGDLVLCPRTSTTGSVLFYTGNGTSAERMRIDSSGNVGIGTTSPSAILNVRKDQNNQTFFTLQNNNAGANASSFSKYTDGTNNAYIGMFNGSSGGTGLNVPLSMSIQTDMAQLGIGTVNASGILTFYSGSGTERMRIDSSGYFLVGTTSQTPGYGNTNTGVQLSNNGSHFSRGATDWVMTCNQNTADGTARYLIGFRVSNGQVGNIQSNGSNCTYNSTSDYRLKENVQPMQNALGKVARLNPVTYKWKLDGSDGEGFIAHELAEVVPECVTGEKDAVDADGNPVYQGIDTSFLVATLTAAIQELAAKNDALIARIETLEGK